MREGLSAEAASQRLRLMQRAAPGLRVAAVWVGGVGGGVGGVGEKKSPGVDARRDCAC